MIKDYEDEPVEISDDDFWPGFMNGILIASLFWFGIICLVF